jgi:hypothetical protein
VKGGRGAGGGGGVFWGLFTFQTFRLADHLGMPKVNLKTISKKSCSRWVFTVTCFQLGCSWCRISDLFISSLPCVSNWKRPSCQAQVFSRAAFLGHRPGSNPQPIELCADIGQVHLMLIWGWLGRLLVIITNGQPSADIKWSVIVRTGATRPQTSSSNVDFPVAWITGPATDPSLDHLMCIIIWFFISL